MGVAYGDRQCVGRVVRQRIIRTELKQDAHHRAHLLLVGAAVAEHCLLDAQRRVFANGYAASARHSRMTPRASATGSAERTLREKNSDSTPA